MSVTVTTEAGQSRAYTVVLQRSPPTYIKASNTGAGDAFGSCRRPVGRWHDAGGGGLCRGLRRYRCPRRYLRPGRQQRGISGAVYVFTRTGTTWSSAGLCQGLQCRRKRSFGGSVALSADGATLAVGADGEASGATGVHADNSGQSDDSAPGSGAVYVFTRTGTTWAQQAYVKASKTGASDAFGASVALSADGMTLAVGANGEDSSATGVHSDGSGQGNDSASGAGAVYVFTRAGATWAQQAYVKASNTGAGDAFGSPSPCRLMARRWRWGPTTRTQSPLASTPTPPARATTARRAQVPSMSSLAPGQRGLSRHMSRPPTLAQATSFGASVALSADGATLAVGANSEASSATGVHTDGFGQNDDSASRAGAVYVFTRAGTTWTQQAYVKASDTGANDSFGSPSPCRRMARRWRWEPMARPRAPLASTPMASARTTTARHSAGASYVFTRAGTTWTQQAYVKAPNTGVARPFRFFRRRVG